MSKKPLFFSNLLFLQVKAAGMKFSQPSRHHFRELKVSGNSLDHQSKSPCVYILEHYRGSRLCRFINQPCKNIFFYLIRLNNNKIR
jgi:hypothetical protein